MSGPSAKRWYGVVGALAIVAGSVALISSPAGAAVGDLASGPSLLAAPTISGPRPGVDAAGAKTAPVGPVGPPPARPTPSRRPAPVARATPTTPSAPRTEPTRAPAPSRPRPTPTRPTQSKVPPRDVGVSGPLVWSDEFTGRAGTGPDGRHWSPQTGGQGWGNNELECYTDSRDNSGLDGRGHLMLTARYQPGYACDHGTTNDYTSAKLTTFDLASMKYGSLRVRTTMPSASGLWPGVWALGTDNYSAGWPESGEIDVAEGVGKSNDTISQTLHGPASYGAYQMMTNVRVPGGNVDTYHVYGVDWSPSGIVFSVDGHAFARHSRADVEREGRWVFDKPFFLLLQLGVGGNSPGRPDSNGEFPQQMSIDYVRVYR